MGRRGRRRRRPAVPPSSRPKGRRTAWGSSRRPAARSSAPPARTGDCSSGCSLRHPASKVVPFSAPRLTEPVVGLHVHLAHRIFRSAERRSPGYTRLVLHAKAVGAVTGKSPTVSPDLFPPFYSRGQCGDVLQNPSVWGDQVGAVIFRPKPEPTRGLEPLTCSLRVIIGAFPGVAGGCKTRIPKRLSLPQLAQPCRVLRPRWCQSSVKLCEALGHSCMHLSDKFAGPVALIAA